MKALSIIILVVTTAAVYAQQPAVRNDSNTPLHALQPDYPVPYGATTATSVKSVLDRVHKYLQEVTPPFIVHAKTGGTILPNSKPLREAILKPGDFRITSYEWGVTYSGMMLASSTTGDKRFYEYANQRLSFLAEASNYFTKYEKQFPDARNPLHGVLHPGALDDAGSICAAMIKAERMNIEPTLRPMIDNFMNYIVHREFRLKDGTLARNRPLPNTLWLDDLYMSVPAIAQMGKLTGDSEYYDKAVKQIKLFAGRMFNHEKGLYMHGWSESMPVHPEFHWARANGWALMTKVEVLDVLPADHPGRKEVLDLLTAHINGLARYQSGSGFWHQLIDRNDTYLETSATAIFSFCITQAINRGWIDRKAYAPMALLAWSAVSSKVNDRGQVEGTCVGTGMAFDPAFYYHRPVNVYAAHGYGPVLHAGAAMYELLTHHPPEMNDSAVMFSK